MSACSDEAERVEPSSIFGSGGGSAAPTSVCGAYCEAIVASADGCQDYNASGRCLNICGFYHDSVCRAPWDAYAQCLTQTPEASCVLPDAGARLTLVIAACQAEFNAWDTCREEKNADFCPY